MDKLTICLALGLGLFSAFAWYERGQALAELETLKLELAANNEQAALRSELASVNMAQNVQALGDFDGAQIVSIDKRLQAALSELSLNPFAPDRVQLDSGAARHDLPDTARTSGGAQDGTTAQPSRASCELYQTQSAKLERRLASCESRLLYEAREFDALATHYQTLLSIYDHVKESLDEYSKDQARSQEKSPSQG